MDEKVGKRSLKFDKAPFIIGTASVVGTKEGEGPLGALFDAVGDDDRFGQDTWEAAESSLQKDALTLALGKSGVDVEELRYIFAGDLLGQTVASSFGMKRFEVPYFGLYGACSTCGESLSLAAMVVAAGYADKAAAVTSSHFASAEKQFRFPLEYANQRPPSATWTVTGGGAFILSGTMPGAKDGKEESGYVDPNRDQIYAKISGVTTGKIVDFGIKDSMNMGAAMAPAAADVIAAHFEDFASVKAQGQCPKDYDCIVTGDLGTIGKDIVIDLLRKKGIDIGAQHEDCGIRIYDGKEQETGAGGSGCGCSAVTLSAYYLPKLKSGELKRVLFVPTGALLSPVSFNEGQTVPGIAHAVVLEHVPPYYHV